MQRISCLFPAALALCLTAPFGSAAAEPREPRIAAEQISPGGALKEKIWVRVENVDTLLQQASAAKTRPVLFIGGQEIAGVFGHPPVSADAAGTGPLEFILDRTPASRDAWKPLLARPALRPRNVSVSVGLPQGKPIPSNWNNFELRVIHPGWLVSWLCGFAVLFAIFIRAARDSALLRDRVGADASYSLGRCQMAWWFFLILAAFLFLYMTTWDMDTITSGTLVLAGISAATALAAVAVDSSKPDALPKHTTFLKDLLSDGNGLSLHRFQIFVWTIVLGVIFIVSVYTDLTMPDFSPGLLALMGISSGTYIGFKIPEKPKA